MLVWYTLADQDLQNRVDHGPEDSQSPGRPGCTPADARGHGCISLPLFFRGIAPGHDHGPERGIALCD